MFFKEDNHILDMMDKKENDLKNYENFLNEDKHKKDETLKKVEESHEERKARLQKIEDIKQELLKNHKPENFERKKKENIKKEEKKEEEKKKEIKQDYFDKLIECKSCGKDVNALANNCPNCGWKVISNQKLIQGLIIFIIFIGFNYWIFFKGGLFTIINFVLGIIK